jgi:hypothetical protein
MVQRCVKNLTIPELCLGAKLAEFNDLVSLSSRSEELFTGRGGSQHSHKQLFWCWRDGMLKK